MEGGEGRGREGAGVTGRPTHTPSRPRVNRRRGEDGVRRQTARGQGGGAWGCGGDNGQAASGGGSTLGDGAAAARPGGAKAIKRALRRRPSPPATVQLRSGGALSGGVGGGGVEGGGVGWGWGGAPDGGRLRQRPHAAAGHWRAPRHLPVPRRVAVAAHGAARGGGREGRWRKRAPSAGARARRLDGGPQKRNGPGGRAMTVPPPHAPVTGGMGWGGGGGTVAAACSVRGRRKRWWGGGGLPSLMAMPTAAGPTVGLCRGAGPRGGGTRTPPPPLSPTRDRGAFLPLGSRGGPLRRGREGGGRESARNDSRCGAVSR